MKNYSRLFVSLLIMLSFISISSLAINANSSLNLKDGNFQIVVSGHEVEPVKLAVATLSKDFEKVMQYAVWLFLFVPNVWLKWGKALAVLR